MITAPTLGGLPASRVRPSCRHHPELDNPRSDALWIAATSSGLGTSGTQL
jgi:hypothetical protein